MNTDKTKTESLANECIQHWDALMEHERFKAFYYMKMTQTLNMDIDEIFEKALKSKDK
ncbi:hypothetical protein ACJRPK_10890 [Aquimarina sp. 2-A2]|uniref:hypothetical protein n=1 Tax=Aquimarina sp. 2-A2 TaxID=3382644 RepID=UPI00387F049B